MKGSNGLPCVGISPNSCDFALVKDLEHKPRIIQALLKSAVKRRWHHLALERLNAVEPKLPLGNHFWQVTAEERSGLVEVFDREKTRRMITSLTGRDNDAPVSLADVAYWVKG